jgi:hypothetical protein
MSSGKPGVVTSDSEVTSIGPSGFWLLVEDREYFVPFADYPVFAGASVPEIFNLRKLSPGQLWWPDLDADIELAALSQPDRFPLMFRPEACEF